MAAGAGQLGLAAIGVVVVLIVLALFERLQDVIDSLHQKRSYKFQLSPVGLLSQTELEKTLGRFRVTFKLRKVVRGADTVTCWYDVWGSARALGDLSDFCLNAKDIVGVEYSA